MSAIVAVISGACRPGSARMTDLLARTLGDRVAFSARVVNSSDEATAVAREAATPSTTVVAVGGDGTVADVATGIFGTGATLAIVPAGSTNITARSLGIPTNPRAAVTLLLGRQQHRRIDVGRSGGRCFLHMAGAGFDAELFRNANPEWKRRFGWLAYLPTAASALRLAPSSVRVTCDASQIETRSPLILVANGGAAVSPAFRIHPRVAVDDGWLDALIFTATTPGEIAATLGHLGGQRLDRSPHVIWQRARTIRIDADPPLAVELDGDARGWTPRQFSIAPGTLAVVTPAATNRLPRGNRPTLTTR